MKILTKGLVLIAVPTVFELALLGFLLKMQADAGAADQWAVHSQEVIAQAAAVERPLYREAANLRLSALTNDPKGHGGEAFWKDVDDRIEKLKEMVADDAMQAERVRKIAEAYGAVRKWDEEVGQKIGTTGESEALMAIQSAQGQALVNEAARQLKQFLDHEQKLSKERVQTVAEARSQQTKILIAAVLGTVVLGVMAVWMFARGVAGRLGVLTGNAQRLAEGAELEEVHGKDEVAELNRVLQQSAVRLKEADAEEAKLRAELQKRADELSLTNEHLRQQTQENEMFIYSVSHDLRSPLVNLQGFGKELQHACAELRMELGRAEMAAVQKKRLQEIVDEEIGESLRFLHTAVSRAGNIIDALLRLSRAGRVDYQMRRVDVAEMVHRVVDAMRGTLKEKGAEVEIKGLPAAFGDVSAIETVFGNLIGNAVNYLDPGRPGRIEVGTLAPGTAELAEHETMEGMRVYYVKDNGLGIPKAYMGKIFTAFQRLHGNVAKGEGIGLALVRRVVERHGGMVWVESEEGVGTTFFVSLPEWQEAEGSVFNAEVS